MGRTVSPRLAVSAASLALLLAGCGVSDRTSIEGPVTVYVSMPQTGPRATDGEDAADGVRLALEEAGMRAGSVEVRAEFLDDARGRPWDPVAVGANARTAVQDSSAAAYIGELDSEPTRASVPITNDAGLLQVSPGAGAVDLTRPATGYPESPQRYQPSGSPSFARTVPADDVQVSAAAAWASELGYRRVAVISDDTPYQSLIEREFADAAEARGVEVADHAIAGGAGAARGVPVYDVAAQTLDPRDGSPGLRTSALLEPSRLPGQGFVGAFSNRFGREPGPYAAYGYEAMALVLKSIAEAGTDASDFRDDVREGAFGAERPDSILGSYSIDSDGDTTECMIQRYRAEEALGAPCPPS